MDSKGESRGIAYVDVETADMAKNCLELDKKTLKDKQLTVQISKPPSGGERDNSTVYVNSLPFDITREKLEKLFESQGPIRDIRIIEDPKTGKPKGYAYIEFESPEIAKKALALNGTRFEKRVIIVIPSISDRQKRDVIGNTLHLGNLAFEAEDKDIIEYFEKHIEKDCVTKVLIVRDLDGSSRGFGFVDLKTEQQMKQALGLKERIVKGRPMTIKKSTENHRREKRR